MIDPLSHGDYFHVLLTTMASQLAPQAPSMTGPACECLDREQRMRRMVDQYFDFIWRSLVRFGVRRGDADDVAQKVFLVASEKLDSIALGSEQSFLFGTALRMASRTRRSYGRDRSVLCDDLSVVGDAAPGPEILTDEKRLRAAADMVLDQMPMDLRMVLVLHDIEELSAPQIAAMIDIPVGTVASRLRRAREDFHARVKEFVQGPASKGAKP